MRPEKMPRGASAKALMEQTLRTLRLIHALNGVLIGKATGLTHGMAVAEWIRNNVPSRMRVRGHLNWAQSSDWRGVPWPNLIKRAKLVEQCAAKLEHVSPELANELEELRRAIARAQTLNDIFALERADDRAR